MLSKPLFRDVRNAIRAYCDLAESPNIRAIAAIEVIMAVLGMFDTATAARIVAGVGKRLDEMEDE